MRTILLALLLTGCTSSSTGVRPDLAAPPDLSVPFDLSVAVPDLADVDLLSCGSTYLNSDAGDACPLGCASNGSVEPVPDEGAVHVAMGTPVAYVHNPPASGNHWPTPAAWGVHPEQVPREQWVHNLEHGGIVLLYNCPEGCDAEVDQLIALRNARPPDQFNVVRVLIVPDTKMPHRFAALAWTYRWQGDVVDEAAITCFMNARYDRAPESVP
jgi:hypothetical protein